jgi:hypothetical protein
MTHYYSVALLLDHRVSIDVLMDARPGAPSTGASKLDCKLDRNDLGGTRQHKG